MQVEWLASKLVIAKGAFDPIVRNRFVHAFVQPQGAELSLCDFHTHHTIDHVLLWQLGADMPATFPIKVGQGTHGRFEVGKDNVTLAPG